MAENIHADLSSTLQARADVVRQIEENSAAAAQIARENASKEVALRSIEEDVQKGSNYIVEVIVRARSRGRSRVTLIDAIGARGRRLRGCDAREREGGGERLGAIARSCCAPRMA